MASCKVQSFYTAAYYPHNHHYYPKNGWVLLGMKQSLQMQGEDYDEIQKAFEQAW